MKVDHLLSTELCSLFEIGHAFSEEVGREAFNRETFLNYWWSLFGSALGEIYVVRNEERRIIAALGASFVPDMFSGKQVASELFWYVLPEFRKSGAGILLLDHFEKRAKMRDCKQVVMVHFANFGSGIAKLYEARGFSLLEQTFKKEI